MYWMKHENKLYNLNHAQSITCREDYRMIFVNYENGKTDELVFETSEDAGKAYRKIINSIDMSFEV